MLTAKENMRQAVRGGNPDRYVNQYEALVMLPRPSGFRGERPRLGGPPVVNAWGVTNVWPIGTPGSFPVHTPDKIVIKDIEHWRDYVHAPAVDDASEEQWDRAIAAWEAADGTRAFKTAMVAPGVFEQTHHLCEISNALIYYMEYEDEMHELLKYLVDWELELAEQICSRLHPDALFHHDDWGSEVNSFLRPSQFEDYFLEAYKSIYGYYHDHGVELVIHHSDSYAANLVPYMIEMGIDVFQGCVTTNNVPALVKEYGGKIAFMGDIDNGVVDKGDITDEIIHREVERACRTNGKHYFIPCATRGGPASNYPGVYERITAEIDKMSAVMF